MMSPKAAPEQDLSGSATLSGGGRANIGRCRWTVCALLFFATTINYIDRQVLGILAPDLQRALRWSEIDYGNIVAAFQAAYALGLVLFGGVMDHIGTRKGLTGALVVWSLAAMAHMLASDTFPRRAVGSVTGFGGMLGAVGGMLVAIAVGFLLQKTGGNYVPLFLIAGFAYLFAYLVIFLLNPDLKPATFRSESSLNGGG